MAKTRLNISIDYDLADFIKIYAQENRTSASEVITQFILGLKRRTSRQDTDTVLADPKFSQAPDRSAYKNTRRFRAMAYL